MRISDWSSDVCSSDLSNEDRANRENYQFPRQCPVCGSETERPVDEAVRRCTAGLSCSGQRLERLIHLASRDALNIDGFGSRSEEHTSELQSLMRISYAVFCLKKKTK